MKEEDLTKLYDMAHEDYCHLCGGSAEDIGVLPHGLRICKIHKTNLDTVVVPKSLLEDALNRLPEIHLEDRIEIPYERVEVLPE